MMYLDQKMKEKWHTCLALSVYLKGSLIKIQIGLAKWKKQFQKKETIKDRDVKRDIQRAMSRNY
jgi:SsrA-binding protein